MIIRAFSGAQLVCEGGDPPPSVCMHEIERGDFSYLSLLYYPSVSLMNTPPPEPLWRLLWHKHIIRVKGKETDHSSACWWIVWWIQTKRGEITASRSTMCQERGPKEALSHHSFSKTSLTTTENTEVWKIRCRVTCWTRCSSSGSHWLQPRSV